VSSRFSYRLWIFTRGFFRAITKIPRFLKYTIIALLLFMTADVGRYFFTPEIVSLIKSPPAKTAFMKHTEKRWKRNEKRKKITWKWVPISRISKYAIAAVVIAEDDKFWGHKGFDLEAMRMALGHDIIEGRVKFGGSTITQQLSKNLYLSPSKNPLRKLKEAVLAWRIERTLSKRRILEIYLNVVEWGDGVYGIEAASRRYYGKTAAMLSPREAAMLASVIPSPRRYDPLKPGKYLKKRSGQIYYTMKKRGMVK
jgi:monofunctional biosynthetic peptidoglycan transglycosylase